MKKVLLILICLAFVFCLSACHTVSDTLDISQYRIVIPENADISTKYASENLANELEDRLGIRPSIVSDKEPEIECEILIGETNRDASKTTTSLGKNEFLLFKSDEKLVLKGEGIYIGAPCGALLNQYSKIENNTFTLNKLPAKEKALTFSFSDKCENVIFMIGDGMGNNHITMSEKSRGFEFVARQFPSLGWSITRSQSVINLEAGYTDSAASGTAMSTGYKTINGYVGLDKDGQKLLNVRELAHSLGAKTAVLTTDLITGATPSAYMCHNISRNNTEELQAEINSLISNNKIDFCKGEVWDDLTTETKIALDTISKDNSSFFIMIEEAYTDKCSHNNDYAGVVNAVVRFNDAIAYATQFTFMHPSTALIVTADHETGRLTKYQTMVEYEYTFGSYNHTNENVPIFALGAEAEFFNEKTIENIELAKFTARAYSQNPFGQSLDTLSLNKKEADVAIIQNKKQKFLGNFCFFNMLIFFCPLQPLA